MDYGEQSPTLDANQAIKAAYDKAKIAHRVIAFDSLVTEDYDECNLAYISSGPGIGEVGTAIFKMNATIVAVISFTYDSQNRMISAVRI